MSDEEKPIRIMDRQQRFDAELVRLDAYEKAKDRLLLALADSVLHILTGVHNLNGALGTTFEPVHRELRNAKIIFTSTLDKP